MGGRMDSDDRFTPRPIAPWFIIAAVASLLFMGFGVVSFVMHIFADPNATLPAPKGPRRPKSLGELLQEAGGQPAP